MTKEEFATVIEAVLEGKSPASGQEALVEHLRSDPAAVADYVGQMRLHALLEWRQGNVASQELPATPTRIQATPTEVQVTPHRKVRWLAWSALAATILIALSILILQQPSPRTVAVAVVKESIGNDLPTTGMEVAPGPLRWEEGELVLSFRTGTTVILTGTTDAVVLDDMTLRLNSGRLIARLEPGGKVGFTVQTPSANVVDLSTEFGVEVHENGPTDVVVFEGAVEVSSTATNATVLTRLNRGEAVSVGADGESRIMVVHREPWFSAWSTRHTTGVVSEVSDNITSQSGQKCYQVIPGGLRKGALAYGDRDYTWSNIPKSLERADLVMTFNADKRQPELQLSISLAAASRLYVFTDDRAAAPEWLPAVGFTLIPGKINLQETTPGNPLRPFSIWERRQSAAGVVVLGSNDAKSMYVIAAVAEKIVVACLGDSITAGSGYPELLQRWLGNKHVVRNYGVSGATLLAKGDKPYREQTTFQTLKAGQPQVVLVMLGTNDTKAANYKHIDNFEKDLLALVDELRDLPSKPAILLLKPAPVYGAGNFGIDNERLEAGVLPAIERAAKARVLTVVDVNAALREKPELFKDRVHPVGGQEHIARSIWQALRQVSPLPEARHNLLVNAGDEEGVASWSTRGGKLAQIEEPTHTGKYALAVMYRSQSWHGPGQDVAAALEKHGPGVYEARGAVRLLNSEASGNGTLVIMLTDDRGTHYLKSAPHPLTHDLWAEFYDDIHVNWTGRLKSAFFYLETNDAATANLVVDDFSLSPPVKPLAPK